ncbi:MAG TPA: LysR family transcriptional regulator [Candidatus Scybalomonas excrementigallinarum]|nr:LysR family transcriptional regulator [Candidatus Scybalomonas excrementigallinarum]
MELRVLKYFLMVAREENITKAAIRLHMTQPTLSRQLIQLEGELGVKLFHRSKHSIILTEEGLLLKRRAQEILSLVEKTKEEFIQNEEELAGEIAIGCGETQNMSYLSEKIYQFRKQYPLVSFQIYSADADDIKERIEQGILDIGLLMEPVDISKYDFVRMPEKEQWGILTTKDRPIANQKSVSANDLISIPLLIPGRESVKNEISNWFGEIYEQIEIAARYNLILNAVNMVRHHVGVAFCFDLGICYDDLKFIPLYPSLDTGAVLVWKKSQMFSSATTKFIEFLRYAK